MLDVPKFGAAPRGANLHQSPAKTTQSGQSLAVMVFMTTELKLSLEVGLPSFLLSRFHKQINNEGTTKRQHTNNEGNP